MARAETVTLLSLDRFAQVIGMNPLHFCQVTSAALGESTCAKVIPQYDWQWNDSTSREGIARAIAEAESRIARLAGYWPLPRWTVDERRLTTQPAFRELYNTSWADVRGAPQFVQTEFGQFISGGVEAKTLISAGAAVVYTDADSDGYPETATIAVATTVTDPAELSVFFPGVCGSSVWEVRPLKRVTSAGGVATIVCRREQLVKPELLESLDPSPVDGDDNANFLTTVDVYRHWNDPQQQVMMLWGAGISACG